MICTSCLESSQHAVCPYCGAPDAQLVGWGLSDVLDVLPLSYKPWEALSTAQKVEEQLPSPADVYSRGYEAGRSIGETVKAPFQGAFASVTEPIAGLATTVKWVVIAGAVVGALVLVYGALKFIPVMLAAAGKQAEMGVRVMERVATKAL